MVKQDGCGGFRQAEPIMVDHAGGARTAKSNIAPDKRPEIAVATSEQHAVEGENKAPETTMSTVQSNAQLITAENPVVCFWPFLHSIVRA